LLSRILAFSKDHCRLLFGVFAPICPLVPSPGYNGLEKGIFHKSSEIRLFLYEDSFNQKKLVEALHISQTALSKRLKLSGIKTYLCCRRALLWLPREVMHG